MSLSKRLIFAVLLGIIPAGAANALSCALPDLSYSLSQPAPEGTYWQVMIGTIHATTDTQTTFRGQIFGYPGITETTVYFEKSDGRMLGYGESDPPAEGRRVILLTYIDQTGRIILPLGLCNYTVFPAYSGT